MKTLDKETLVKLIRGQAKSADLWINEWKRYKDVSGIRNASLAIGKINGLYLALIALDADTDTVPDEIMALMRKYLDIWSELHISKDIAGAISKHG